MSEEESTSRVDEDEIEVIETSNISDWLVKLIKMGFEDKTFIRLNKAYHACIQNKINESIKAKESITKEEFCEPEKIEMELYLHS